MQIEILKRDFWKGQRLILLAFLLLHTAASFYYISHQNITFDEPQYIEYAKRWLQGKPERIELLDDSKSPVIAVCWLPRIVRQVINPDYQLNDYGRKDQAEGRYIMIIFSLITAVYVYWWCKELYGKKGWYLPLLLLLFDPLYLSYSTIITTDLACGTFLVTLLYHYRKYLVYAARKQFYAAAIFAGLGIVTKQTMLFVVVLLPLISLIHYFSTKETSRLFNKRAAVDALVFLCIVILVINVSYYFHRSFTPFGRFSFESQVLQHLQQQLSFLHWLPVPLPEAYVQSIDMLKAHADLGAGKPMSTFNGVYLFGELKETGGFWYYYLVLLFYKLPIGTLLLIVASIFLFIKQFTIEGFAKKYLFLLLPILFYGIILSFFNHFQIGIRHILLLFPLLFIGLGKLFQTVAKAKPTYKLLLGGAVVYTFISVATYYPYIIPYTNEFIGDKKTVYRKIMDSSIDYGQSDSSVSSFIAAHPGYKAESPFPAPGKYAVPMDHVLNGHLKDKNSYNPYEWYQKLEPSGLHRNVVLLFDITEEDLEKAGLRK